MFTFFKQLSSLGAALAEFTRSIQEGNMRFRQNLGLDDPPAAITTTIDEEVPALGSVQSVPVNGTRRSATRNGAARK